jgi:Protein of unknown function (DUF3147)
MGGLAEDGMRVRVDPTPLRQTRWQGHLLRFVLGGLVTVATGLVAKGFGPNVGGMFLAFPAIFPVGLAMIERLQDRQVGRGARGDRARRAAIAEAVGAVAGSVGMAAFALGLWLGLDRWPLAAVFGLALLAWAAVALGTWAFRRPFVNLFPHRS